MQKLLTILIFLSFAFNMHAFTVVLDAGHGGHDAGAVGSFSKEKNINLRYTLLVGDMIKKSIPDAKVIYTRDKDVFVDLNQRAKIANKNKADLFVSIHTNSSKNTSANGMETFTLGVSRSKENMEVAMLENSVITMEEDYQSKYEGFDPNSVDSYIMFEFMKDQYTDRSITCADFIQKSMINASKRNDRGVRQAGFLVLRATTMPSVLIELGFISNKEEEKFLNNNDNQVKLATAIFNAIKEYKHELDKKSGRAVNEESNIKEDSENNKKLEVKTEEKKDTTKNKVESKNESIINSDIEFYIQYLVSKNNYSTDNKIFKGHKPTKIINENTLYKYLIGPLNVDEIESEKNKINKDFPDAFVVAYKNGKKTSTPEAIQEAKNN